MVDVVVVQEAQVWRGSGAVVWLERQALGFRDRFFNRHDRDFFSTGGRWREK